MQVLVDVGAHIGYFSLAAAAKGHRAIAFELSAKSAASFKASIEYNGFGKAVTLHQAWGFLYSHGLQRCIGSL